MKKPNIKFSNLFQKLKNVFSRKKAVDIEDTDLFDSEDYEDYVEDETNPTLTQLTVKDIKKKQIEEGEALPDLPQVKSSTVQPVEFDDSGPVEATNPSVREFDLNLSSSQKMKNRVKNFARSLKFNFTKKQTPSFTMGAGKGNFLESIVAKFKKINFDGIFDFIFSAQSRPRIHRYFIIFLAFSGTYLTARMLLGYFTPIPTAKLSKAAPMLRNSKNSELRKRIANLRKNDLFNSQDQKPIVVAKKSEPAVCDDADTKSGLSLKLVNTVVLQDSVKSLASVQVRGKKKEEFLRVGDKLPGMIEIGRITSEKLFFKNLKSRQCEYIQSKKKKEGKKLKKTNIIRDPKVGKKVLSDAKKAGIKNSGNSFKIKKDVRKKMLENISEVLTQARAIQIKNADGSLCFKMQEVVPGSIYTQLGIQEGDKVCGINGKKISNIGELMNTFGQIDKIDHFELDVSRNGIDQNLEYDFE